MARVKGLKILKVENRGYDTFVTAKIKLPRSNVDGWGILDFEKGISEILKQKFGEETKELDISLTNVSGKNANLEWADPRKTTPWSKDRE